MRGRGGPEVGEPGARRERAAGMVRPLSESSTCPGQPTASIFESPSPTTLRPSACSTAVRNRGSAVLRERWVLSPIPTTSAPTRPALPFPAKLPLHGDHLYVQVSQSAMGYYSGILFRTLQGPKRFRRRSEQLRVARLAQQVRRTRALDPRGVRCLTSSAAALPPLRHGHAVTAIAAASGLVDGREPGVMQRGGFRRTRRSD